MALATARLGSGDSMDAFIWLCKIQNWEMSMDGFVVSRYLHSFDNPQHSKSLKGFNFYKNIWVAFLEKLTNLHGLAHPSSDRVNKCRSHLAESELSLTHLLVRLRLWPAGDDGKYNQNIQSWPILFTGSLQSFTESQKTD